MNDNTIVQSNHQNRDRTKEIMQKTRIRELERENQVISQINENNLDSLSKRIHLMSDIYQSLQDCGRERERETGDAQDHEKPTNRRVTRRHKGGTHPSSKGRKHIIELKQLREENKVYLQDIKEYKEAIWLQSRTIRELTDQQNELLKSVSEYRICCAKRLETITELGKRQRTNEERHLTSKGVQTEELGVSKEVQCFMANPCMEREQGLLQKRQEECNSKFEGILKMMVANTCYNAAQSSKKLKVGNDLAKKLVYNESTMKDRSEFESNMMLHSSDMGNTEFIVESLFGSHRVPKLKAVHPKLKNTKIN